MPIVPVQSTLLETSAIRLARYSQVIGYDECRFWGLSVGTPSTRCREIWTLPQRIMIAKYLAEAQFEFEKVVGYPIGKRWIVEDKRDYKCPALAKYSHIIMGGVRAVTDIGIGAAVSHLTDPAVVGPIAYTGTDPWEVHVYHPGTEIEIDPSNITIAGGTVTIDIPRCRMVTIALADNPTAGLQYTLITNFEATVDVKRVYNDPSTQAVITTNHRCTQSCSCSGCSDYTSSGCVYVNNPEIGKVEIYPATYSLGAWRRLVSGGCCNNYRFMQLNYLAGVEPDYDTEDAIVRLAHSKMPQPPCGTCEPANSMWTRDRNVPTVLTAERLNNPFGLSDGAWFCWMQAITLRVHQGAGIL